MPPRNGRKKKSRRRRRQATNVLKVAQDLVVANAATKTLFGTNLDHFLLDGWFPMAGYDGSAPGSMGGSGNSWAFSAKELIAGIIPGGSSFGQASSYPNSNTFQGVATAIGHNFRANAATGLTTMVLAPIGFRVAKKLLRSPINLTNRTLKAIGVKEVRV